MYSTEQQDITATDVIRTLWRYRYRCLATAIVVTGIAVVYIFVAKRTWEAAQAVIVRDEAANRFAALGKLRHDDEVKNTQQNLLEIALSRSLLKRVLDHVGPPEAQETPSPWPTEEDITELRSAVSLAPPKGAEFGKTEVFYLKVKARSQERALQLVDAVFDEIQKTFGELRAKMTESTIAELQESTVLTEKNLAQATGRLSQIEKEVGIDLVALRMLHQSPTGDTSLYRSMTSATEELRLVRTLENQHSTMLDMLTKAKQSPQLLVAAPKELLDCHPGLVRLIQGLSESRLHTAGVASKLTGEHPEVRASIAVETGIRKDIQQELGAAIQAVTTAKELAASRRATLETLISDLNQRLDRISRLRAEYSNLVAQVDQRRNQVEEAQRNLAQTRASLAAATVSSLLSRVDAPDGGQKPIGPRRSLVLVAGMAGGLLAGFGVVFLTAPIIRRRDPLLFGPFRESAPQPVHRQRNGRGKASEPMTAGDYAT